MAEAQEFPYISLFKRVIIATKGLPCTGKSVMAKRIGEWARCSVLYVDDFLTAGGHDVGGEEAERLHRLAFDALCKAAYRHLDCYKHRCVVIKSRLCSTFELDRLLRLPTELPSYLDNVTIIIIECHVSNENRLYKRLDYIGDKEWYKARTRLDFEKARDDDWLSTTCTSTTHPAARDEWDLHLCNLLTNNDEERPRFRVIRLVLDPFLHLDLDESIMRGLTPSFRAVIRYLILEAPREEEEVDWKQELIRDGYAVVHFDKLRRYLAERELNSTAHKKKTKYLCPDSSNSERALGRRCCVFKTYTPTKHHQDQDQDDDAPDDDDDCHICGVCNEPVPASSDEGGTCYTCHFCFLTLHKSCAEYHGGVTFPSDFQRNRRLEHHPKKCYKYLQGRTHACKSCKEGGRSFFKECNACLFQTHLKCRLFPTAMNHDSHPQHLLSLQVGDSSWSSNCKACGDYRVGKYGCYVCGLDYCLRCVLRPGKLEHTHGGHHHVLELVYTRDGMEPEEDYWCGVCSKDMDPDYWFYSCQDCPSYEAHPECIMPSGSWRRHWNM